MTGIVGSAANTLAERILFITDPGPTLRGDCEQAVASWLAVGVATRLVVPMASARDFRCASWWHHPLVSWVYRSRERIQLDDVLDVARAELQCSSRCVGIVACDARVTTD